MVHSEDTQRAKEVNRWIKRLKHEGSLEILMIPHCHNLFQRGKLLLVLVPVSTIRSHHQREEAKVK